MTSTVLNAQTDSHRRTPFLQHVWKHETVQGIVVLIVFLAIFFSQPLTRIATDSYSPADIAQEFGVTNTVKGYFPRNPLLSDTVAYYLPYLLFDRDSIRAGQLPLWNPFSDSGMPVIGNYQSAVFSIFSAPFYVLPIKFALLLSAFLKLFGSGLFTFLFLKQINLKQVPALVGAVAFMFCGYNVVWLGYTIAGAVVTLPTTLYFAEQLLSRFSLDNMINDRPRPRSSAFWPLLGVSLSLAVGLFAGHPETFFACCLVVAAYILFRLIDLWRAHDYSRSAFQKLTALAIGLGVAAVLAATLAAVQLLPFGEYLANSDASHNTAAANAFMPTTLWPLVLYPNLFGIPSNATTIQLLEYGPLSNNYNETNGAYIGGFVFFLAIVGVIYAVAGSPRHRKYLLFFGAVGLVWLAFATNLLGFRALLNHIPGISTLYYTRSYHIFEFALSCCAALFINHILEERLERRRLDALVIPLIGLSLLALFAYGAYQLIVSFYAAQVKAWPLTTAPALMAHNIITSQHIQLMTLSYGVGMIFVSALVFSRRHLTRIACSSVILAVIFFQSGFLLKNFNSTIPDNLFFPDSADTLLLRETLKSRNVAPLGWTLIANVNLGYKIPLVTSYDALGVRNYLRLIEAKLGVSGPILILNRFDESSLRLFGVDTLIVDNLNFYKDQLPADKYELASKNKTYNYAIYQYKDSVPLYHVVYQAVAAPTDDEALTIVQQPDFDAGRQVVLSQPDNGVVLDPATLGETADGHAQVDVVSEAATDIHLKVTQDQPGYLVLTKTYYPGWKMKVNGVSQPIYRANYAFSAVALQSGESQVEYYYEPNSVKYGGLITLATLLLEGVLVVVVTLRQRRARTTETKSRRSSPPSDVPSPG